ncbi:hypothetical protein [Krasilnikovia sp. M28-CT-15]|uniref:hypothetical protein n=1 Tax=Krasilnikovia sp. M28-CT-15 TaxID=3373540 RepID=UPI00399CB113
MRRSQVLAVVAIALTATAACGSTEKASDGGAKVATLTSPEARPSASAAAQRPRERLDTSPEEFEAMLAPYNKCLKEHGISVTDAKRAADRAKPGDASSPEQQKADESFRSCEAQYYPLPPWEKDPANPEARDFAVAVVKCLKKKGVTYVEVSDDGLSYALGGRNNDARSIRMGMDLAPDCEREVAAAKKK